LQTAIAEVDAVIDDLTCYYPSSRMGADEALKIYAMSPASPLIRPKIIQTSESGTKISLA
jgi:hypothetical protein